VVHSGTPNSSGAVAISRTARAAAMRLKQQQTAKHQKHTKMGPEPKQNTHKIDLPVDAVAFPKTCQ